MVGQNLACMGTKNDTMLSSVRFEKQPLLLWITLYFSAISKYNPPGLKFRGYDLREGFLCYKFGGLIFGWAYFRNFAVTSWCLF